MGKYNCYSYGRCEKYRKWKFTLRTPVIELHSLLICTRFYELQRIKFHWNRWPSSELPAVMSEWAASFLCPTSTKKYWEWDGIILLKFLFCGRECVKWHIRFFFVPFFKLLYLSWSLTAECCKGPFLYPSSSMCVILLQINAAQSEVKNDEHNIKNIPKIQTSGTTKFKTITIIKIIWLIWS